MVMDWIQKVRKVSSDVDGSASVKNPNFVGSVICAYLSRNIYRSGMRKGTRDKQISKAVGGEEFLRGVRNSRSCTFANFVSSVYHDI